MSLRTTLLLLCLALVIGGGELLRQSAAMPEWTDEDRAMSVMTWDPPQELSGAGFEAYYRRWTAAMRAVRTEKWPYHDAGAAFATFGFSLAAGLFLLRIQSGGDVKRLMTPTHKWSIWLIATFAWFGYMASAILALLEGFDRSEFPPWADSILAPIMGVGVVAVVGWVLLSAATWFVLRHSDLPASLWVWRKDLPMHTGLSTVGAGLSILIALELMRETYLYGHWLAMPFLFLWVYTALVFRAAFVADRTA